MTDASHAHDEANDPRPRVMRWFLAIVWFYLGVILIPTVVLVVVMMFRGFDGASVLNTLGLSLLPTLGMACILWLFPPNRWEARRRLGAYAFWMGIVAAVMCFGVSFVPYLAEIGSLGLILMTYFMCGAIAGTIGLRLYVRGDRVAHDVGPGTRGGYDGPRPGRVVGPVGGAERGSTEATDEA